MKCDTCDNRGYYLEFDGSSNHTIVCGCSYGDTIAIKNSPTSSLKEDIKELIFYLSVIVVLGIAVTAACNMYPIILFILKVLGCYYGMLVVIPLLLYGFRYFLRDCTNE